MNQRLIHPDLIASLYRFFNSTCSIQSPTIVAGPYGNTDPSSWTTTDEDVKCDISRISNSSEGNEVRRKDMTIVLHPYAIVLQGVYTVSESYRIVSAGVNYDVMSVNYDSKSNYTSLICELLT